MSLDRILHQNQPLRTEAQAKAERLLPMTDAEVRSLTDAELATLEREAYRQRMYYECDDGCITPAISDAICELRKLGSMARAETLTREGERIAEGTLKTLSGIDGLIQSIR